MFLDLGLHSQPSSAQSISHQVQRRKVPVNHSQTCSPIGGQQIYLQLSLRLALIYRGRSRDEGNLIKNPDCLEDCVRKKNSCDFLLQNLRQLQPEGLAIKSQDNHDGRLYCLHAFIKRLEKRRHPFCLVCSLISLMAIFYYKLNATGSVNVYPALDIFPQSLEEV